MRCYLYKGERLVFEGEGWGIIVDDGDSVARTYCEGFVYGTHQECTAAWRGHEGDTKPDALDGLADRYAKQVDDDEEGDRYSYGENCWEPLAEVPTEEKQAVCCLCNQAVPDGVQALIHMEQWNRR